MQIGVGAAQTRVTAKKKRVQILNCGKHSHLEAFPLSGTLLSLFLVGIIFFQAGGLNVLDHLVQRQVEADALNY